MNAMPDVNVILLLLGPPASRSSIGMMQLSELSIELGLYVKISTNPLELAKVRAADRATVVIVSEYRDGDYDVFALISVLRCARNVGVIMLTDHHIDSHRLAFCAGAHACLPNVVEPETFRSTVRHVARRCAPPRSQQVSWTQDAGSAEPAVEAEHPTEPEATGPATNVWRLASKGWQLNTPDGLVIELTATERLILSCLFEAQRETVAYADILAQNGAEGALVKSIPLLAGTISRLRKKCDRKGVVLPILAYRGKGYRFAAEGVVG